jgi:hypothetical protein
MSFANCRLIEKTTGSDMVSLQFVFYEVLPGIYFGRNICVSFRLSWNITLFLPHAREHCVFGAEFLYLNSIVNCGALGMML